MKIRLGTNTPPADYQDGQILTSQNINDIVTILKGAINNNYDDLVKIIAGDNSIHVFDTLEALQEHAATLSEENNGDYGLVLDFPTAEENINSLRLYTFVWGTTNGTFVLEQDNVSIVDVLNTVSEIDGEYDIIIEEFETINNTLGDLGDEVGSLDTRLGTAEATITTQGNRLTTAEGEIDTLQSDVVSLDGRLDTIEGDYVVSSDLNDYLTTSDATATYQPIGSYALTSDLDKLVKGVAFDAYNQTTGEVSLTITFEDDTTAQTSLDLKLELIPISGAYNASTNALDFTLDNGTTFSVPVSDLLNLYYGDNATTPTIDLFTDVENKSRFRLNTTWIANTITTPLAGKLATNGDASATTAAFTQAAELADLTSGDSLAVIFGKLKKLYNSLGDLAFLNVVTANEMPSDTVFDADYTHTDNNLTNELVTDINNNTIARHTHANKSQLDSIVGIRNNIALETSDYDGFLATIGAIKNIFNLPATEWDGNATTLGYKTADVNATADTIVLRDANGSAAIAYSNPDLVATTVVGALDELNIKKANVSDLSSNILLYPTDSAADVATYFKLVTSLTDPDYDTTAVDIPTGTITTTGQLLASLVSAPGLFIGNPGVINVTTIGNIRKTGGNSNQYAEFYFEIYKRDSLGDETLIATSDTTGAVNPLNTNYREFSATAILNNGNFTETDRIVIKYYANAVTAGASYDFQFGGTTPVRTLLPVPVSVIPIPSAASDILTDSANFTGILSGADDTAQKAFETLDQHNHDGVYAPLVDAKIPADYLPSVALTDTYVVANTTEMTGLNVEVGDIAIVTELSKTFVLAASPASTLANWKEILTPADGVQSVSGSGAITASGTSSVTVGVDGNYVIPTTAEKANYDTAYGWGDHSTAGYATVQGVNKLDNALGLALGSYQVKEGETIAAGDLVDYLNTVTDLTIGDSSSVNFYYIEFQAVALDNSRILIVYDKYDYNTGGRLPSAMILSISGTTITQGIEFATTGMLSGNSRSLNILDSNRVLFISDQSAVVLFISGTTISAPTPPIFFTSSIIYSPHLSSTALDSNTVLVTYTVFNMGPSYGHIQILSISGTTITFNSPFVFNQTTTLLAAYSVVTLDSSKVLISYVNVNENAIKAQVLSISGTTITTNNEFVFTEYTNPEYAPYFKALDNERVLMVYRGNAQVLSISGTTISAPTPKFQFTNTSNFNNHAIFATSLDNNNLLLSYARYYSNVYAQVLSISGTTITSIYPEFQFTSGVAIPEGRVNFAATIDSFTVLAIYADYNQANTFRKLIQLPRPLSYVFPAVDNVYGLAKTGGTGGQMIEVYLDKERYDSGKQLVDLESSITTLESSITTLESSITTLETTVASKAVVNDYTRTLVAGYGFSSGWGEAYYYDYYSPGFGQQVSVSGVVNTDKPIVDLNLTGITSLTQIADIQAEWAKVYKVISVSGAFVFFASEIPTINIPVAIRVVK